MLVLRRPPFPIPGLRSRALAMALRKATGAEASSSAPKRRKTEQAAGPAAGKAKPDGPSTSSKHSFPFYLMKNEPEEFGVEHLVQKPTGVWDGVRNGQAKNYMKAMKCGQQFFFYHSSCKPPGIAGIAEVVREVRGVAQKHEACCALHYRCAPCRRPEASQVGSPLLTQARCVPLRGRRRSQTPCSSTPSRSTTMSAARATTPSGWR